MNFKREKIREKTKCGIKYFISSWSRKAHRSAKLYWDTYEEFRRNKSDDSSPTYRNNKKNSIRYCKKNKGKHSWVEEKLPNSKYPYFKNEWEKRFWGDNLCRYRFYVCSKCNKHNLITEYKEGADSD
ncbi:MAG: hypothetical protein NT030_07500, partial [Candidatus Saganbacteria bacterium]|nr:hypothetical protein [Candidatus Saganbacteria bacterium]